MTPNHTYLHIARVTFETRAPLSIGGGKPDGVFDVEIARDANGLPVIPGASLAGVLRHHYQRSAAAEEVQALFGYAQGDQGLPSRVQIGWAHIHDSQDKPLEGLVHPMNDELLKPLVEQALPYRDHVRISHRGAAEDHGKFDRSFVPTGMRFTCEIRLWSESVDDPAWNILLGLMRDPVFRLGGATRKGFGKLAVIRLLGASHNLASEDGLDALARLDVSLANNEGLIPVTLPPIASTGISAKISLKPEAGWRFGAGSVSLKGDNGKPADALPASERIVEWRDGRGSLGERRLLIPASSIKGALSHRVAYHYNRLAGCFATPELASNYDKNAVNPAVRTLFGHATDHDAGDGQIGRILFDDSYLKPKPANLSQQMHNSIDRFTGGVRDKVLFSEEVVHRTGIALHMSIAADNGLDQALADDPRILQSLSLALDDLTAARLPLGAGSAKGHGYFTGAIEWSDDGRWIKGERS